jgi:CBS domain-containing protein
MAKIPERVADIMTRRVETLAPDAEVHDAVRVLLKRGYAAAPVTEPDGSLLGVFSEQDCIRTLSTAAYEGWPAGTVAEHMTKEPETIAPDDALLAIARRFSESRHRSLPVVRDGKVVGLVGRADVMRALDRVLEKGGPKTTYELIDERRD